MLNCQRILKLWQHFSLISQFVDEPRSFCFRGLAGKDDRVHLYTVAQDRGTSPETAMELFNDAKEDNVPSSRGGWQGRGQGIEIVSGFYSDSRPYLRGGEKVFLIINPGKSSTTSCACFFSFSSLTILFSSGAHSNRCTVVRPNSGRYTEEKKSIRTKLVEGRLTAGVGVNEAMRIWKKEFELGDIPANEEYQFSCKGRHQQVCLFDLISWHSKYFTFNH